MNLEQLKSKLNTLLASSREIFDLAKREAREVLTADETVKLEGIDAEVTSLEATIAQLSKLETREAGLKVSTGRKVDADAPVATPKGDVQRNGFKAWALGVRSKSSLAIEAAKAAGFDFFSSELALALRVGVNKLTDAAGKYTVETELSDAVEIARIKYGSVTTAARNISTSHGNPLAYITVDDGQTEGSQIAEQGSIAADGDGPTFGRVTLGAWKIASETVPVSSEFLEDSSISAPAFLGELLGHRVYRKVQKLITTGAGTTEPKGIVTCAAWTVAASGAGFDWYDEILNLIHRVDPEYRTGPSVGFMLNDDIVLQLRKVRYSEDGPFVWQDGASKGNPASSGKLFGYPVTINQAMAVAAPSAKAILFGDMSKFLVRTVGELNVKRFDEKYADTDEIGFRGQLRVDSNLLAAAGSFPIRGMQLPADYSN